MTKIRPMLRESAISGKLGTLMQGLQACMRWPVTSLSIITKTCTIIIQKSINKKGNIKQNFNYDGQRSMIAYMETWKSNGNEFS